MAVSHLAVAHPNKRVWEHFCFDMAKKEGYF